MFFIILSSLSKVDSKSLPNRFGISVFKRVIRLLITLFFFLFIEREMKIFESQAMSTTFYSNAKGNLTNFFFQKININVIVTNFGKHSLWVVKKFMRNKTLLVSFSGSLVANYPFDDSTTGKDNVYSPTADDRLFVALAYSYARAHPSMWKTGRRWIIVCLLSFFFN